MEQRSVDLEVPVAPQTTNIKAHVAATGIKSSAPPKDRSAEYPTIATVASPHRHPINAVAGTPMKPAPSRGSNSEDDFGDAGGSGRGDDNGGEGDKGSGGSRPSSRPPSRPGSSRMRPSSRTGTRQGVRGLDE